MIWLNADKTANKNWFQEPMKWASSRRFSRLQRFSKTGVFEEETQCLRFAD
jgi:hypothetical protein